MSKKSKLILLAAIAAAIPLTVILSLQVQNYRKNAAEPVRKMALGISLPYGFASKDINTDLAIAEIEKFASPVANGGVGAYPASFSIWTDFGESSWRYGQRSKFPDQKLLNYLDSKKITPMIFMAPLGPDMKKDTGGTLQTAMKYSNQSIANGSFDAYFIEWANAAKVYGKPVILRYAWEMNGNWFPWSPYSTRLSNNYFDVGNTPQNYIAAWRHIYNVIKPIAPNVEFYWCPNYVGSAPNAKMASFYPGNNYVDYVGFDAYNWNPNQPENENLSAVYAATIQSIRHIVTGSTTTPSTIPMIVGETGLLINNDLRYEKLNFGTIYNTYPDIKSIVYFDLDPSYLFGANTENGIAWRLSGKSDNPANTTQGVDLRPKYNSFVVQERFQGNLNPEYEATQTPSPSNTPMPSLSPTKNPSPTPTLSPTKSPTPTPTKTPTPSPTPIISQTTLETKLNFTSIKLHGIGNGGDNTNPTITGNTNPLTKTKVLSVEIFDSNETLVSTAQGNVNYSTSLGYFTGTISLNSNVNSGMYIIKIKTDKYLKNQMTGIISIVKDTTIQMPAVALVTGDSNNDNRINISDFNIIIDCYSDLLPPKNCSEVSKKTSADLSDDGFVNSSDYNLFMRELSAVSGN